MITELTFQNQDGTHIIKYLVGATSPVALSDVMAKVMLEVSKRLGPAMIVENQPLDYVI